MKRLLLISLVLVMALVGCGSKPYGGTAPIVESEPSAMSEPEPSSQVSSVDEISEEEEMSASSSSPMGLPQNTKLEDDPVMVAFNSAVLRCGCSDVAVKAIGTGLPYEYELQNGGIVKLMRTPATSEVHTYAVLKHELPDAYAVADLIAHIAAIIDVADETLSSDESLEISQKIISDLERYSDTESVAPEEDGMSAMHFADNWYCNLSIMDFPAYEGDYIVFFNLFINN